MNSKMYFKLMILELVKEGWTGDLVELHKIIDKYLDQTMDETNNFIGSQEIK